MLKLDRTYIEELASGGGVRRIAVENFLMTVANNPSIEAALMNLVMDAGLYHWNAATVNAIRKGIWTSGGILGLD